MFMPFAARFPRDVVDRYLMPATRQLFAHAARCSRLMPSVQDIAAMLSATPCLRCRAMLVCLRLIAAADMLFTPMSLRRYYAAFIRRHATRLLMRLLSAA